ncbi:WD_REPEATS_REGION domain-containing protein [Trichonephila clavata]|uniref:WD_REPEATS_REGION domain-containing protein n=1 Tax=Trichonephila clavata TaxID=2740835 RepID=A0A8X6F8A6_TRICU|nr:WD_REPEATS_REGION domain-containing protein [Trichonephila clavata]
MKRQSIGLRRGSEESRSQINENKRLKVFHPQDENLGNHDLEAGSGSDSTEEYINVNGQDRNMKNSIISENGSSIQQSLEKNIPHNSTAKSSFVIFEEKASASNHVNGNYVEESESCSVKITSINSSMNGSGETSLEVNSSFTDHVNSLNSINDASQFQENSITEAIESFQSSNSDLTTYKKSDIEAQHTLPVDSEVAHLPSEVINEPNIDQSLHLPSTSEHSGEKSASEDISDSLDNLKESYYSEETNSQNVIKVPSASQKCIDIENITLCQLKVVQLEGHADVVFCVDADEDFILSSSGDTTVKVWDVEEGKEISNFAGHNAAVTSVILLSSTESEALRSKLNCCQASRIAASASYDCHIRLWSVLDGFEILSMYTFNSIICMGYLKNQMYVVVGTEGGKLEVWDLHLAKLIHFVYAHDSSVSSLKIEDCYVYSTSKDGTVKVWLFDEEELQPLYTRRRKEIIPGSSEFGPTQWQTVAVYNDLLFLGDNTRHLKALDWRIGRLRLFSNQPDDCGICEAVLVKDDILLTTFFGSYSDTGGINVWHLPEMTYVGTLTGDLQEICSLAMVQMNEKLRIVSGGHQLIVWDFDFSKPPQKNSEDLFFVCEVEKIGSEVNEESVAMISPVKQPRVEMEENVENKKSWCNIS